ncbi:MAG: class I SAM-dependent methyltransferase [Gammaproteobacteria bacterium]|nr:class I SAM-dependent methyltransferase [Gammaproteobacteria bacterium]
MTKSILKARAAAQQLAFGPMVFQAVRILWKSGVLTTIDDAPPPGPTLEQISEKTDLSSYALGVLLEVAESADVISRSDGSLALTKTGSIILYDKMTQVNVDFVHDVCYQGLFLLDEALATGKPAGLRVFSDAATIYDCITELPDDTQNSWYAFDHFYSDRAFKDAVGIVFETRVTSLMDIGGNTGRWAMRCLKHDNDVEITIADLPGQLTKAREIFAATPFASRVRYQEVDLLKGQVDWRAKFDVVWMSQFLDCFSETQIARILDCLRPALTGSGRVFIMEPFVDRQKFAAATYSLNAISLYFTAMANGNSRMYRSETVERIVREQGYEIVATHNDIGLGQTLLECKAS